MRCRLPLFALLFPWFIFPAAFGQWANLTATKTGDGSGAVLASGKLCIRPVNIANQPLAAARAGGGGAITTNEVCTPVAQGTLPGVWWSSDPAAGGTNLVPDPVIVSGWSTWTNPGTGWSIATGAGYTGVDAIEVASTAAANGNSASAAVAVTAGQTYTFGGYIDATGVSSLTPQWVVENFTSGVVLASLPQTAGHAGWLQTQFVAPPGVTQVKIVAGNVNAVVSSGQTLKFSAPLLQAGFSQVADTSVATPTNLCYRVTVRDASGLAISTNPCVQPANATANGGAQAYWCSTSYGVTSCNYDSYSPAVNPGVVQTTGPTGPIGLTGQGYNERGAWAAGTAYAAYDVYTYSGNAYVVTAGYTSGSTYGSTDTANTAIFAAGGTGTDATAIHNNVSTLQTLQGPIGGPSTPSAGSNPFIAGTGASMGLRYTPIFAGYMPLTPGYWTSSRHFGDSRCAGADAPTVATRWVNQLATLAGVSTSGGSFNNNCVSGTRAADITAQAYANFTPANTSQQLTTLAAGVNDFNTGPGPNEAPFNETWMAAATLMSTQLSNIYQAGALLPATGWTADNTYPAVSGAQTTTNGAALTFTLTLTNPAQMPFVNWYCINGDPGAFTVVDSAQSGVPFTLATSQNVSMVSSLNTIAIDVPGTGWAVGDKFAIAGGNGGIGQVTAETGGVPSAVAIVVAGSLYSAATGAAATAISPSSGTGLTVTTTAGGSVGAESICSMPLILVAKRVVGTDTITITASTSSGGSVHIAGVFLGDDATLVTSTSPQLFAYDIYPEQNYWQAAAWSAYNTDIHNNCTTLFNGGFNIRCIHTGTRVHGTADGSSDPEYDLGQGSPPYNCNAGVADVNGWRIHGCLLVQNEVIQASQDPLFFDPVQSSSLPGYNPQSAPSYATPLLELNTNTPATAASNQPSGTMQYWVAYWNGTASVSCLVTAYLAPAATTNPSAFYLDYSGCASGTIVLNPPAIATQQLTFAGGAQMTGNAGTGPNLQHEQGATIPQDLTCFDAAGSTVDCLVPVSGVLTGVPLSRIPATLDSSGTGNRSATSSTTVSTSAFTVTAGDAIVCEVNYSRSAALTSLIDNVNNDQYRSALMNGVSGWDGGIFYLPAAAAGSTTVTLTIGASYPHNAIACQAWKPSTSGAAFSLDSTMLQGQTGTTANPTSGSTSPTPSGSNEIVVANLVNASSLVPTAGASFTLVNYGGGEGASEYWNQTTATVTNGPFTMSAGTWAEQQAAFYFQTFSLPPSVVVAGGGSVTSVCGDGTILSSGTCVTSSGNLAPASAAQNTVIAGPASGGSGPLTARALVTADMPNSTAPACLAAAAGSLNGKECAVYIDPGTFYGGSCTATQATTTVTISACSSGAVVSAETLSGPGWSAEELTSCSAAGTYPQTCTGSVSQTVSTGTAATVQMGATGATGTISLYSSNAPAGAILKICPGILVTAVASAGNLDMYYSTTTPGGGTPSSVAGLTTSATSVEAGNAGGQACMTIGVAAGASFSFKVQGASLTGTPVWETHPMVYRLN